MLLGGDIERIKDELQPLFTEIKNLVNTLPKGSIKRIQKGYFSGGSSNNTYAINISITPIDVSKSILIIDRNVYENDFRQSTGFGAAQLNSNHIYVAYSSYQETGSSSNYRANPFYWQVIEFN